MNRNHLLLIGLGAALYFRSTYRINPASAPALAAISALDAEVKTLVVISGDKAQQDRETFIRFVLGGKVRKYMVKLIEASVRAAGRALNAYQFAIIHAVDPKLAMSLSGDKVRYEALVREVGASSPLVSLAHEKNITKVLRNAVLTLSPHNQRLFAASCASRVLEIWQKAVPGDEIAAHLVHAIQKNADGLLSDAALSSMRLDFKGILAGHTKNPVAQAAGQVFLNAALNAHSIAANEGKVAASITELSHFVAKAEAEAFQFQRAAARNKAKAARAAELAAQKATREAMEEAGETALRKILRNTR